MLDSLILSLLLSVDPLYGDVVDILGIVVGVNAACINVITEWLSDFKLGYCSEGWYLNQQFCCWQESLETCKQWKPWSSIVLVSYVFYILFAVLPFFFMSDLGFVCIYFCISCPLFRSIRRRKWNQ
jgi:H+/Cl- antiporter ClcA